MGGWGMAVAAVISVQPAGTPVTQPPFSASDATRTSPAAVPSGFGMVSELAAVVFVAAAEPSNAMPLPGTGVGIAVGVAVRVGVAVGVAVAIGVALGVQT